MKYKFGVSIEMKLLKKLNKFKKRPSELYPSNQKMNLATNPVSKLEGHEIQRHLSL